MQLNLSAPMMDSLMTFSRSINEPPASVIRKAITEYLNTTSVNGENKNATESRNT
jgi:hypothetical protein